VNTVDIVSPDSNRASGQRRPLRVCHVAYTFYETDNRVVRYAREMQRQGNEIDVIALRRPGDATFGVADGVRLFRIQRRSVTETAAVTYLAKLVWFTVKAAVVLAVLHARRRYDLVHVHNIPDFLIFSALVPKLTGARLILDIHDLVPELYAGKFGSSNRSIACKSLTLLEKASCAFADHVIVANDLWYDALLQRSAKRCTSIINYPDLSVFKPSPAGKSSTNGRFVFLYPGSLNHHQGVDLALKAFSRVRKDMPRSEFHVYGEGPDRPLLDKLVGELGLGDCVRIRDRVPIAEMAEIIASASVGVVPKRADGFGNEAFSTKTLEFMASNVPVIVSRTRVDSHYFNSTLVRFFEPGDDRDLAAAMLDTFQNREAARLRADSAQRFAIQNSWQQRGRDYLNLIDTLVANGVEPRPFFNA
jgi:glycosyltransferase involved in cell wall biosynthesis